MCHWGFVKEETISLFAFPYGEISVSPVKAVQSEICNLSNVAYRNQALYPMWNCSHVILRSRMKICWFFIQKFTLNKTQESNDCFRLKLVYIQVEFMPHPIVFTHRSSIYKYIVNEVNILDYNLFYWRMISLASTVHVFKTFLFLKILKHIHRRGFGCSERKVHPYQNLRRGLSLSGPQRRDTHHIPISSSKSLECTICLCWLALNTDRMATWKGKSTSQGRVSLFSNVGSQTLYQSPDPHLGM